MTVPRLIGLFGGTFDPIHFGHIRAGYEVYHSLQLDEIRFIPCGQPPHRTQPTVKSKHRLAMCEIAINELDINANVFDFEIKQNGPSYAITTIKNINQELNNSHTCLIIGMDSYLSFTGWYQWEEILENTNIVVVHRPQYEHTKQHSKILLKYETKNPKDLRTYSAGKLYFQAITPLAISASTIREQFKQGLLPYCLMPNSVINYIQKNGLYQSNHQQKRHFL